MKTLTLAPVLALAAFALVAPPQAQAGDRQRQEKYERSESRHRQKYDRYQDRHREKHYRNDYRNDHRYRPWRSHRRYYSAPRYRSHTYYRDYDYYDYDYDYGYYDDAPRVYTRIERYCPRACHRRHHHHFRPRVGLYLGF